LRLEKDDLKRRSGNYEKVISELRKQHVVLSNEMSIRKADKVLIEGERDATKEVLVKLLDSARNAADDFAAASGIEIS
jgi:hypothetical protein